MNSNAFILREAGGIPFYSCTALEALPGLLHGFSTRNCSRNDGTGGGDDSPFNLGNTARDSLDTIEANRRRFLSALGLLETPLATLRQIHSDRVHIIKEFPGQWNTWNPPEGDALATRDGNIALAVQTADCIPLLIADPRNQAIAAVHSGWRGTLQEIAVRTVQEMRNAFGTDPAHLLAAIGPGIRCCCFEVGPEVAEPFGRKYPGAQAASRIPDRPGKYFLDLAGVLRTQLEAAGIRPENVHDSGLCTCCNPDTFFSFRAEGAPTGRMLSVIAYIK